MPSLKTLKTRIKSIKSTQKITKAMKMVAASKLKKARDIASASADYAENLLTLIANLAATGVDYKNNEVSLLTGSQTDAKRVLLLVVTSDKGLCGAFNMSIVKEAKKKIAMLEAAGKAVQIITIGKKAYDLLKTQHAGKIVRSLEGMHKNIWSQTEVLANDLIDDFYAHKFDKLLVVFSVFQSVISQEVVIQQMIPLNVVGEEISHMPLYDYEPNEEAVLAELLPKNVATQIYRAILESIASEHAARMTAMDGASRNSSDMIKKLTTVYNRSRQSQITKELIEIISGSEAING